MNNIKFEDLGLKEGLLKAIKDMGFEEPSQIQAESIPIALQGFDIIGQAQTGTGKTAAFGCAIINNMTPNRKLPKALILAPTRELAIQVNEELVRLGKHERLSVLPIYGGQPIDRQFRALKQGVDIVVGTPGRILDHIRRGSLKLDEIEFLVLDEADEMLNMGFIEDIEEIVKSMKSERQTLLFSATMPKEIKNLAQRYMKKDLQHISIKKNSLTVSKISQYYFEIKHKDRFETLCRIIDFDEPNAAIIFCKTKKGVDELVEAMQSRGYVVEGMHGDMTQNHRMMTLKKFKEGNLDFLVATDVAARGIDVEGVTHVINYDLPQDNESYVHRIGRTGRANREGIAYSLVTPREYISLKQIQKATKSTIHRKAVPTADEIFETKFKNIINDVKETIEEEDFANFVPIATELDEEYNLVDVAAALMKMLFDKQTSFDYSQNSLETPASAEVRLFLSIGRRDGITPKTLVNFIKNTARVGSNQIGDIDLLENFCFVNVAEDAYARIMDNCSGQKLNRRKINIEVAKQKR
ncbi:ATP-dependent RNA helicase DeaD [Clostridium cavendishii DSM 21758]|uniref:ATP-dependent RNA helicase CshA n=1 Tax=Clostridium cavendishii DSM 21758 TaxID=1121302 RepID=A0A1M6EIU1_9CLOT|nr:DEAD/DEAH box helicase [Clostridium cavendishii]SHI85250.1 ATP-dependent RNA helicase DeaD [Clostridium cavendishii DSM 21758]